MPIMYGDEVENTETGEFGVLEKISHGIVTFVDSSGSRIVTDIDNVSPSNYMSWRERHRVIKEYQIVV